MRFEPSKKFKDWQMLHSEFDQLDSVEEIKKFEITQEFEENFRFGRWVNELIAV